MKIIFIKTVLILTISLIVLGYPISRYVTIDNISITVKDKERVITGSGQNTGSKYLIYTENEVFENTDSWLFLKFNSSDFQGRLEPNKTYKIRVTGFRLPFLSSYRNIIKIY